MLIDLFKRAKPDTAPGVQQDKPVYRKIGAGACGAVFAKEKEGSIALKFAKATDGMLWNDYQMHVRIQDAFAKYSQLNLGVNIPKPQYHIGVSSAINEQDTVLYDSFLSTHPGLREALEPGCNLPTACLGSQRILPLSEKIRNGIIDRFYDWRLQKYAREDPENEDCLVRVYLGSEQGIVGRRFSSLRNFKLSLSQMMVINVDGKALAHKVARALAVMHWEAETDARDVEFVLGSPAEPVEEGNTTAKDASTGTGDGSDHPLFGEPAAFWVLDFNQVRRITLDADGVRDALNAVTANDPYFPRPLQENPWAKDAWDAFASEYQKVSSAILRAKTGAEGSDLPTLFLQGLIGLERSRQAHELPTI